MQEPMSKHIKKRLKFIGPLILGSFIFFIDSCLAATPQILSGEIPVKVNANDMVYDMDKHTVTFTGSVVVTRGEFVMKAAEMQLFIQKSQTTKEHTAPAILPLTGAALPSQTQVSMGEKNNIERIEAYDGVTFNYGPQSGASESAVYNAQKGLLTMRGNPVVREGENLIKGDTIIYYTEERRSKVIGSGKKRVEAIFNSNN